MTIDGQREFLETELWDLLSEVDCDKLNECISHLRTKTKDHPSSLDLRTKKTEIDVLLADLRSLSSSSSFHVKRELLDEVIATLTTWFGEIWQMIYEWRSGFEDAHRCLMYAWEVLEKIRLLGVDFPRAASTIGCRCTLMSYPLAFAIKDSKGKTIKTFSGKSMTIGNADKVLLWLWRELFVSLSATRCKSDSDIPKVKEQILNMMLDVEGAMDGPNVLERILHGGGGDRIEDGAFNPFEEDEWQDESDDEEDNELEDDSDEDGNDVSETSSYEGDSDPCECSLHASHWSPRINYQRLVLRDIVLDRLVELFSVSPSLELYRIVVSTSPEIPVKGKELLETLSEIACASSSSFAAALEIYSTLGEVEKVLDLLETHTHLLRPCDAKAYQMATRALATSPITTLPSAFPTLKPDSGTNAKDPNHKQLLALKIIEAQLKELTHTIHLGVLSCFDKLQDPIKVNELREILRVPFGSSQRASRVEEWVEAVETPPSGTGMNPMAFAAFMMSFGGLGGMGPFGGIGGMGEDEDEDADLVNLLDQLEDHGGDEDYMYLKEEYSPPWGDRFEGWTDIAGVSGLKKIIFATAGIGNRAGAGASTVKICGGQAMLQLLYVKMAEDMPWLKAKDVVDEMVSRLRDRPARAHIMRALESLNRFAKLQRSNLAIKAEKKKRHEQKHKQREPGSSNGMSGPPPLAPGSGHQFNFGPTSSFGRDSSLSGFVPIRTVGGLNDVD
ncbi:hypothetical protein L218DRAFT_956469 [Marasmius fiardii PR-910]|nr:hypothetical protein L218DRAFT_956469 [Marasmius fiardii PR-910]